MIEMINSDYIMETKKGLIDAKDVICNRENGCISYCRFMNHACEGSASNVHFFASLDQLRVYFRTKVKVKKGTELCISYVKNAHDKGLWFGRDDRNRHQCCCVSCMKKMAK